MDDNPLILRLALESLQGQGRDKDGWSKKSKNVAGKQCPAAHQITILKSGIRFSEKIVVQQRTGKRAGSGAGAPGKLDMQKPRPAGTRPARLLHVHISPAVAACVAQEMLAEMNQSGMHCPLDSSGEG
ncbi:hypothetical protein RFM99_32115 [Mesorhizobium sp. VK4C]|uniref:hypothetical protein n=1 Tax=Mesorhizobium captivum TaxID=3072319 RepID=UPI002A241C63|nr:hypothetical protein [Mesorhizobium sp. VK4C]MDX8503010.1 hypothetical protein [Mesorhizobium sp. VK4C]